MFKLTGAILGLRIGSRVIKKQSLWIVQGSELAEKKQNGLSETKDGF